MQIHKLPTNARATQVNEQLERIVNRLVRAADRTKSSLGLAGRKAAYDDDDYEFFGGANDRLRRQHYDKSLRLLWKAEEQAPYLPFSDASNAEKELMEMALRSLTPEEQATRKRLTAPEFKAQLDREYTPSQQQAIVNVLAAIGHGEAYAWLVSADLLGRVKSTGARAALTMQVFEEAKHFVVLRELLHAFEVPIPRLAVWEYLLLESSYKAKGMDQFFGMNVVVEGIALSLFGMMSHMPGLEVLRLFHLDESRHTALPVNYFKEFPLTKWQRKSPAAKIRRLKIILPALLLIPLLEKDLAEIGIDAFDFGGSVLRKITQLSERAGFELTPAPETLLPLLSKLFNGYCKLTRPGHTHRDFLQADTTIGERELAVEREAFSTESPHAAA